MQHGEIIHSSPLKDFSGNEIIGSVLYHVRVNKAFIDLNISAIPKGIRKMLNDIPDGIYMCVVGIDPDDKTVWRCDKL